MNPMIGQIIMFAGNFAPRGWAFCNGQLLPIAQNTALFSILGTIYGGDGRTTFALPDMRGRVPMHPGHGPGLSSRSLGQRIGNETNTLNVTQIPVHNHPFTGTLKVSSVAGTSADPSSNYHAKAEKTISRGVTEDYPVYSSTSDVTMAGDAISGTIGSAGGNQGVNNIQPSECVNFIIAMDGVYPSRN